MTDWIHPALLFVAGALVTAVLGLPDRFDPRRVMGIAAVVAAIANLTLVVSVPGSAAAIAARDAGAAAAAEAIAALKALAESNGESLVQGHDTTNTRTSPSGHGGASAVKCYSTRVCGSYREAGREPIPTYGDTK
mgnify:CR=1 FL=1